MYELASLAQSMDHIIINPPSYSFYKSILNESEVSAHLPDLTNQIFLNMNHFLSIPIVGLI